MDPRFPQSMDPGHYEDFYRIQNDTLCRSIASGQLSARNTLKGGSTTQGYLKPYPRRSLSRGRPGFDSIAQGPFREGGMGSSEERVGAQFRRTGEGPRGGERGQRENRSTGGSDLNYSLDHVKTYSIDPLQTFGANREVGGYSQYFGSPSGTMNYQNTRGVEHEEANRYQESITHQQRFDKSGNSNRLNFQERNTQPYDMNNRTSSEEQYRVGPGGSPDMDRPSSANRDGFRQTGSVLKSSSKYSKPPILQTAALGNSTYKAHQSIGGIGMNSRSMRYNPDHDDLRLKLEKLVGKFVEKNGEKDSFRDTFFDQEIFKEIVDSKNYFKLSLDLLKYVLHSGNQAKKKAPAKKAGGLGR